MQWLPCLGFRLRQQESDLSGISSSSVQVQLVTADEAVTGSRLVAADDSDLPVTYEASALGQQYQLEALPGSDFCFWKLKGWQGNQKYRVRA